MISVVGVYEDVSFLVNDENGFVNKDRFNNASWLAQLRFIDWLTGGSSGEGIPQPYINQKNSDWLNTFKVKLPVQVSVGKIKEPDDYYIFDNLFKINSKKLDTGIPEVKDVNIDLLTSSKFTERINTFIDDLKPTANSPIAKRSEEKYFEFYPKDAGSVCIEYIRYPKRSELKMVEDSVFHTEEPDTVHSIDFEWGEYARNHLVWFIVDEMANHTREQALKQFNEASKNYDAGK